MTEQNGATDAGTDAAIAPVVASVTAGARLRDARTAAGLSIDAVAQQLKLAPRQVVAIEECDFPALPGRTFVRGFVRNYARLLQLDGEALVEALPEAELAPTHSEPSLAPSPRPMGELPADVSSRPSAARWAIPLALVAIIAIAAVYEWTRPQPVAVQGSVTGAVSPGTATSGAPAATPGDAPATGGSAAPAPVQAESTQKTEETVPAAPPADAPLAFEFRGTSWVEVKDAKGTVTLSTMGYAGARHVASGSPPLEVVIGNAEAVTVIWRGKPFDLAPHIRQNVAKFSIE